MKALTLTQPWATLVATEKKKIETRSWSTNYRGPLAIHAAKAFPIFARKMCSEPYFITALQYSDWQSLPTGKVIATCELVDVVRVYADEYIPGKPELMFGDYSIGRYMWKLENVVKLPDPIPAKGALGLWEWDKPEGE